MKAIRLSRHAQQQLQFRGGFAWEVEEAIQTSPWEPAELGRLECRRDYPFHQEWNGVVYETKRNQADPAHFR